VLSILADGDEDRPGMRAAALLRRGAGFEGRRCHGEHDAARGTIPASGELGHRATCSRG